MNTAPAFQKSYDFYKKLYVDLRQIPKRDRFTWGEKCEHLAIDILRDIAKAKYSSKAEKASYLKPASDSLDLLKIFLRLGYDLKIIDQKKYILRQTELQEIGSMVGGWLKSV